MIKIRASKLTNLAKKHFMIFLSKITPFFSACDSDQNKLQYRKQFQFKIPVYFQVKYYRDTYAEHPDDRENIEYSVHLESNEALVTLTGLYDQLKDCGFDLQYFR